MSRLIYSLLILLMLPALNACGGGGGGGTTPSGPPAELVRVLISAMSGTEPLNINSDDNPTLFVLGPGVGRVDLTVFNEVSMKDVTTPATFWATLGGVPPFMVEGYIEMTILPLPAEEIRVGQVVYTTSASVASNPSSLLLQSGADAFTATLSTINLDMERTESIALPSAAPDVPYTIRWAAANDFGENGGGAAGFSTNDLVVSE